MAQLDKIIKVMLDQPGADILLVTGSEPQLRLEGNPPHVLINRKLTAPHLRLLLGELAGEAAVPQIEAADGGEFTYQLGGQQVLVVVRAWSSDVEARVRSAARKPPAPVALARVALAKAPASELRKQATNPVTEARARSAPEPSRPDSLELDLSPRGFEGTAPPSSSNSGPAELEFDLSQPPSSNRAPLPPPAAPEPVPIAKTSTGVNMPAPVIPPVAKTSTGVNMPAPVIGPQPVPPVKDGEPAIHALFRAMIKQGGSDLHLSTGERPMIRRDGDMIRLDENAPRLKGDAVMDLLRPIFPERNASEFERDHDTDFAYEMTGISRFRGNVFVDRRGVGACFRTIPTEIATVEKLGLSPAIQNLCYLSKGLVLVTGPTGSGKSTTLSALIDLINRTRHDHVITIEDPIEFVHQTKSCLINQREVGPHTESFKRALRAALREDPDVVMVGEMRDLETISIAMETAETGHLVFGTLHTSTAYSTIDRLIDSFASDQQQQIRTMLSESLKGVIAQTLCKKIGGGRIAAYEILLVNSAISNLIREGKTFQVPSVMQTARKQGMMLLNDALYELVEKKKIEPREGYIKAVDKANFVNALRAGGHKLDFLGGGG